MSVPLPSPSTLPSASLAKPIPRRPAPISLEQVSEPGHASGSPGRSPSKRGIAGSGSRDRRGSRSASAAAPSPGLGQSPGDSNLHWRDRVLVSNTQVKGKAPERTVGGFGKKDGVPGSAIVPGLAGASSASEAAGKKLSAEKALAHVPCRFYKAGTCTAGDSCPFSHEGGGKKEVCQWFLKGNCKFGHKCALAHLRPGEPISMDRKNKKAQQAEAKADVKAETKPEPKVESKADAKTSRPAQPEETPAAPVPIRSALASSLQTPPSTGPARATGSSPMREPYGPPSGLGAGSPSGGFGRSPGAFGASPNRPSPLSASFSARLHVPGSFALKGVPTTAVQPSRQPVTAGPSAGFSSSLSHSPHTSEHSRPPLSASFADGNFYRRSIWAHTEKADEALSPRRPIMPPVSKSQPDVFDEEDDDHGEDLIPSSLSELLTPTERARRGSRRDSNDYFAASPARSGSQASPNPRWMGERMAQSAGAAMEPVGFLKGLWSPGGSDIRNGVSTLGSGGDLTFGPATAAPATAPRQSLLSQQRSPVSPLRQPPLASAPAQSRPAVSARGMPGQGDVDLTTHLVPPFFSRPADPSSPSAKALSEHAPGQSLPGGVATALSRLHLQGEPEGARNGVKRSGRGIEADHKGSDGGEEREEVMFAMDG